VRTTLDSIVNVATLITCCAVLAALGTSAWNVRRSPLPPNAFRAGDRLPAFDGLRLDRANKTLVMVLKHDCHFCAESLPFYKSLRNRRSTVTTAPRPQLVVLTGDDRQTATRYLETNSIEVDGLAIVPTNRLQELRIAGTPTLLLVNHTGLIERVWIGKLDFSGEEEVRQAIGE
jgi:hypothetical protein